MIFDAALLTRGWLSVALASGDDKHAACLDRTVLVETFTGRGVRLVATNAVVLLTTWVAAYGEELDAEPGIDEVADRLDVVIDPHSRGRGFLAHVRKLASDDELQKPIEVSLRLDERPADPEPNTPTFDGFEGSYARLGVEDLEEVWLPIFEGPFPAWRQVWMSFAAKKTEAIALAPDIIGDLAKLGRLHPTCKLGFRWSGRTSVARLDVTDSDPYVEGFVMPCRWDLDRNEPLVDTQAGGDDA